MIVISAATHADVAAIAALMDDLERFYGASAQGSAPQRVDYIDALLFGGSPAAHALLARVDDYAVGLAAYSFLWPAVGITHSIFLKELYVRSSHRRQGVGTALMRRLCEIAISKGCSRVEWTTEHANADAVDFYSDLGAPINAQKVFYRLDTEAIALVAAPEATPGVGGCAKPV